MKTVCSLIIVCMLILPASIIAQCSGTVQTITYDTTVAGNGEEIHSFTFPKFNIPTGTLLEIQLKSEVTISYGFTAENTLSSPYSNYRVRVTRNDDINSDAFPASQEGPINLAFPTTTYGFYNFTASDGSPGAGTDFHGEPVGYALNHILRQRNFSNTAAYLGIGNVDFEYAINSSSIVPFGTGSSIPLNSTSADTLTYSITYVYCQQLILAPGISEFTATKKDESRIDINWTNNNESTIVRYILEKSTDGRTFEYVENFSVGDIENKKGSYQYQYNPTVGKNGKIFFRIKQIDGAGAVKYSPMRMVEFSKPVFSSNVYPNPSNGQVNVAFHNKKSGDWTVEVLSINGQLLERTSYKNILVASMNLQNSLKKGTYLVKLIENQSQEQSVHKIIIR